MGPGSESIDRLQTPRIAIRPGRHAGWWAEGWSGSGRRFALTWWPTRGLAHLAARVWAGIAGPFGRRAVTIEGAEPPAGSDR